MGNTTVATTQFVEVYGGMLTPVGHPGRPIEIRGEPLTVGRAEECSLVVRDKKVSALHADLVATPNGVRLRDLGSRNGTFVELHQCVECYLRGPARLQWGETIYQFTPGPALSVEAESADAFGQLVGIAPPMKRLFHLVQKVAPTELVALILGETGTGKELVAQAIHAASPRAAYPFVVIDCASIPAALAESFLFGHEKGAFTGASDRRISPFVRAAGGTVFLDEIGELPLDLQPKLLRVLQERKIQSVGGNGYQPINVRVVAATRRELAKDINSGAFRSDLYFRLAQIRIDIPPLRERPEDIVPLVQRFAREIGAEAATPRISAACVGRLQKYDWPGNVRELRNAVVSALALAEPYGPIEIDEYLHESRGVGGAKRIVPFDVRLAELESSYWREVWAACEGNLSKMARDSGRSRPFIRTVLERLGLRMKDDGGNDG